MHSQRTRILSLREERGNLRRSVKAAKRGVCGRAAKLNERQFEMAGESKQHERSDRKTLKEKRLTLRFTGAEDDRLKKRAGEAGAKNLSGYVRRVLECPVEIDPSLIKEIQTTIDLTIRTRQAIGSLTGNINQIAAYYNSVWGNAAQLDQYVDFDRKTRIELLPEVKALRESNTKLIGLCNKILGISGSGK